VSRVFRSTYHDTEDRRLGRSGVALRRRLENGASSWEVELPEAPGRVALAVPGGPVKPPASIADLLQAIVGERRLVQVLTVQTRRSDGLHDEVSILEGGTVVREFVRDHTDDDPGLDVLEAPSRTRPGKKASPREHVQARLQAQYEEILAHDPGTRLGEDREAVHKFRVAVRRARSLLRSARAMLDPVWADELRAELGWLGRSLGGVRDLDVLVLTLRQEVEELEPGDRGAADRLLAELSNERAKARRSLEETLESRRYLALLETLEEAARKPRWNGEELPIEGFASKAFRKLEKSVDDLGPDPSSELLHQARIRAKRARYAAEVAAPVAGKPGERFIERAREFQDATGEHQDAVVTEQKLREFLESDDPGVVFVAGRLAERQAERRSKARRQIPKAWKRLERAGRKAWK
jgi:CHAD domain-containing protein